MKRIVFFDTDPAYSCTRIMIPNEEGHFSELPKTATNVSQVDETDVPADRTFRNAWKPDLTVDMPKARDIHRDRLRAVRAPLLAHLDIAYQRADESGDKVAKKTIAAQKQALRDVTADPAIEAAQTPAELSAVMPAALAEPPSR